MSRQVLSPQAIELDAFRRLTRASSVLRRALAAEVLTPRSLTINDFDALLHLSRAEEGRLRRIDLVGLLTLTPSGVTRLLEGLQEAGYVENVLCDSDARVTWARLTDAGNETLACVGAEYTGVLRGLFAGALDEGELEQLSQLLEKLPGVGAGSCAG